MIRKTVQRTMHAFIGQKYWPIFDLDLWLASTGSREGPERDGCICGCQHLTASIAFAQRNLQDRDFLLST